MAFLTHEAYFDSVPPAVRSRLSTIQSTVESLIPEASRCISYRMPAFRTQLVFFYFAAFKKHIGIYPPVKGEAALIQELAPYRGEKGNLSFALDRPLPIELLGRVAIALHREHGRTR
jgi:uncharacterized protein YdhG (YjbR/CyaY superfamily)